MPLIVKELNIKVTMPDGGGGKGEAKGTDPKKNDKKGGGGGAGPDIIAACVEQVLDILQEKKEP